MPVVVTVSSAIFALAQSEPRDNGQGTGWFHGRHKTARERAEMPQTAWISVDSGRLRLDLAPLPAISPANPARDFLALFVFARVFGVAPGARKLNP